MKICGICGRTISRCICENPWNLWENNLKMQRMAPTDIGDEHGYRGRRSFPQIAQMNTDTGIYKICEICGICGRINLKQQKESPTDSTDEHGYWVRRSLPQIARMNTDIGIYRICEYLWNQWENKSQAAEAISHISQKITDACKNQ